jgi:hypothetical protein
LVLGFFPAFALSIFTTTKAYFDGMLGRPYSWVKTQRSGAVASTSGLPEPTADGSQPEGIPAGTRQTEPVTPISTEGLVIRSGGGRSQVVGTRTFADRRQSSRPDQRSSPRS